jgi:GT2 family glycosyltransferase
MNGTRIAVLLTCFNRKQKTLACLEALFNQTLPADTSLTTYLVDEASTDGIGTARLRNVCGGF